MSPKPEQRENSTTPTPPTPPSPAEPAVVYRGSKFNLEVLTIRGSDGVELRREVIRHPGAVVILPILEQAAPGKMATVVLIRNHRIALGRSIWELPAGTLGPGEDPGACAARELEEETGLRAATLVPLARFYTTPGMTDELMWAYAATGLGHVGQRPEPDERITVHSMSASEALAMIGSGELMDGKSIGTLLLAQQRGLLGNVAGG